MTINQVVPREIAIKLCDEIRTKHKQRGWLSWLSIWGLNCWGCYKFTKGDAEKMCLSSEGGCAQVNKRYKRRKENQ